MAKPELTPEEFDAIIKILKFKTDAKYSKAARMILVEGMSAISARAILEMKTRSTLSRTLKRIRETNATICGVWDKKPV